MYKILQNIHPDTIFQEFPARDYNDYYIINKYNNTETIAIQAYISRYTKGLAPQQVGTGAGCHSLLRGQDECPAPVPVCGRLRSLELSLSIPVPVPFIITSLCAINAQQFVDNKGDKL
jgi:hypothetical protein